MNNLPSKTVYTHVMSYIKEFDESPEYITQEEYEKISKAWHNQEHRIKAPSGITFAHYQIKKIKPLPRPTEEDLSKCYNNYSDPDKVCHFQKDDKSGWLRHRWRKRCIDSAIEFEEYYIEWDGSQEKEKVTREQAMAIMDAFYNRFIRSNAKPSTGI